MFINNQSDAVCFNTSQPARESVRVRVLQVKRGENAGYGYKII